jgi:polar amino acid transport system substrate-binding protein
MKQVLQNMSTGRVTVEDVPEPALQPGRVLVRTAASVISAGTDRVNVVVAKKSLITNAKERPQAVKNVIERAKNEGIAAAYSAVRAKLDSSLALGYSAAGIVMAVAPDVRDLRPGDRVACAGTGYATHAEMLSVPRNLCVRVPENVSFEEAAFGTLGAIALQGVRLVSPTLGESAVVIGLGLLGQITVQLLKANGCRVFGVDTDAGKFASAIESGASRCATPDDAVSAVDDWSRGRGADCVVITAGTSSNGPIELAGEVSRLKGRVAAVGFIGLEIPRATYFRKELALSVSMSYGPGRYDPEYEERGHDYPISYVRWTEGRNIEAFLDLISAGSLDVRRLITHRFEIGQGADAYKLITGEVSEPHFGVVLRYDPESRPAVRPDGARTPAAKGEVHLGVIGAGDYARAMLLPHFKREKAFLAAVATATGVTAKNVADHFGFQCVETPEEIIASSSVNTVVIATRNDSHASLAAAALRAGKHVFVEKPLALDDEQLDDVVEAARDAGVLLTVGFNRRFSPAGIAAKKFFSSVESPLSIVYRVNAGRLPAEHWGHDPKIGGGRIIAEVCHFVDLVQFLTDSRVTRVHAEAITSGNAAIIDDDSVVVNLKLADGSVATIAYLGEGDKSLPKERVEILGGGRSFIIDDFRETRSYAAGKETVNKLGRQDKGQAGEVTAFCRAIRTGSRSTIELAELINTTRATFRIVESLRSGQAVDVPS